MSDIMKLVLKYKWNILIIALIMALSTSSIIASSLLFKEVFKCIVRFDLRKVLFFNLLQLLLWVVAILLKYLYSILTSKVVIKAEKYLELNQVNNLKNMALVDFKKQNVSTYVSQLTNDINQIEIKLLKNIFVVINGCIATVLSISALFFIHYLLGIFSLTIFAVLYFVPKIFNKQYNKKTVLLSEKSSEFYDDIKNELGGFEVYDGNNMLEFFVTNMLEGINQFFDFKLHFFSFECSIQMVNNLLNVLAQIGGVMLVGILVCLKVIPIGAYMSFGNVQSMFFNNILVVIASMTEANSMQKLLSGKMQVLSEPDNSKLNSDISIKFDNEIKIEDLNFAYDDKLILHDFSKTLKKGRKYAITGPSGSGKSTIIKLITKKELAPDESIYIDGKDINSINRHDLNDLIGYVSQEAFIFNGDIKDNIIFNNPNISDKKYNELVKILKLDKIIAKSSSGDNGKNLSGGEKQRIALARTLLFDKDILILDEATSAIDRENRQDIEHYLLTLPNKTILFITHNLDEDNINYFNEIIEIGKIKK